MKIAIVIAILAIMIVVVKQAVCLREIFDSCRLSLRPALLIGGAASATAADMMTLPRDRTQRTTSCPCDIKVFLHLGAIGGHALHSRMLLKALGAVRSKFRTLNDPPPFAKPHPVRTASAYIAMVLKSPDCHPHCASATYSEAGAKIKASGHQGCHA